MTQPQLQSWLDQLLDALAAKAQGLPFVGGLVAQEVAQIKIAVDAAMPAIYQRLTDVEVLTVQVVFDALRAALPAAYTPVLNIVQGLIDSALADRFALPHP